MEKFCYILLLYFSPISVIKASESLQQLPENKQCLSKHPIPLENLYDYKILGEIHEPLILKNFNELPFETILENNDHTILITLKYNAKVPTINFGSTSGLPTFRFEFFYLHWHENPTKISGAELHAVFYNNSAENLQQALNRKNNVVVFAFNMPLDNSPSLEYDILQANLQYVRTGFTKKSIENQPLSYWLPNFMIQYILYEGHLTFFNCEPQVLWADFANTVLLNPELMKEFKLLKTHTGAQLMDQYKTLIEPTGPLVTNFGDYVSNDDGMHAIPFVDTYNQDDLAFAFNGAFQRHKLINVGRFLCYFIGIFLIV